ncbi:MAG: hypothetical protein V7644_2371 [Actinomycetota bacterium]|jgi:uncharacterized protein YkwD
MLRQALCSLGAAVLLAGLPLAASARAAGRQGVVANRLATAIVERLNTVRRAHGLVPLALSPSLSRAAARHTGEMAAHGYFAHASADHSGFALRIRRWYRPDGWRFWSVGENLLWRTPDVGAARAIAMWMHSPEHRANILNAGWRQLGIAAAHYAAPAGTYARRPVTIVTTDFGVRRD